MRKKYVFGVFAALAMTVLVLDTQTAIQGTQEAILLCIQTVIPTLFPFFFLSGIINQSLLGYSGKALKPLGKLCSIPKGAEPLLLLGLTGGYPVGAQAIGAAYECGYIEKEDAQRMLGFCSTAGPAFVFGLAGGLFENRWACWILWIILILSALITGMFLPKKETYPCKISNSKKGKILEQAIKSMTSVCGWVVLFRVLLCFLNRWILWIIPQIFAIFFAGLLELTNGCVEIHKISSPALQFILLAGMLSFGGMCVGLQTVSVTGKLSCKTYFLGKILQTGIAMILSLIVSLFLFPGK